MNENTDFLNKNRNKIEIMKNEGIDLYPNNFRVKHNINNLITHINSLDASENDSKKMFVLAGRMISINRFGKSSFFKIKDRTGIFQGYIKSDMVGPKTYNMFKRLDIGDFVGVKGSLFKTKTEEWTLLVNKLKLVAKSIRSLPEKFHGLRDPEKRYRQRYLDLLMNPNIENIFLKRSQIIYHLRSFFMERGFIEVETPMMQTIPGGAEAAPFKTHHNALNIDLYLRIAPELYLKRLVVGGFERVFEINRNFRNEGISIQHNPEFTMLEFYQAYSTYEDLMKITEKMFAELALLITGSTSIKYQGDKINLGGLWNRISMDKALEKIAGIPISILKDKVKLINFAEKNGIKLTKTKYLGKIITKLFEALVEPKLIQPTFITGYPVDVSPLSKRNDINPEITDRFELFIAGREIANGFSELNNPEEQHERFMQQVEDRKRGNLEAHHMDYEYIEAMEYGMPPTAGEGIGIDRLVMLLTDAPSIREVILFPHMRPKKNNN